MNTAILRSRILDMAIHGQLVPQDPTEGTAAELLKEIAHQRGKAITPITDDVPFEIPDSWEWVRLGDYLDVRDGTHDSPKYVENGIPFVTSKNLVDGKIDFSTCKYITEIDHRNFDKRSHVDDGDILYAMIGSIGNPVLVKKDREFSIKNVALFKPRTSSTNMHYVYYWLMNKEYEYKTNSAGGLQPFISLKMFRGTLFPLPPLNEQQRIVSRVEELLKQVDIIEQAQLDIRQTATILRSKILDKAIHGRLVPQDPTEGTASDLLKEIAHQRGKAITPITDDVPFDIPESWEWVRLGDVMAKMKTRKPVGQSFMYIDIDAIDNKSYKIREPKIIETKNAPSRASRYTQKGDTLFSMVRPYLRNIALVEEDDYIASTGFYVMSPICIYFRYLFYFATSNYFVDGINKNMRGDNSPSVHANHIEKYLIPLPPLNEQRRIVAKIEELFKQIDILMLTPHLP